MTEIKTSTFRAPSHIISHTVGDLPKAQLALMKALANPSNREIFVRWPDWSTFHAFRSARGQAWNRSDR